MISKELMSFILEVDVFDIGKVVERYGIKYISYNGIFEIGINDLIAKAKEAFREKHNMNILIEFNEMWYAISIEAGTLLSVGGYFDSYIKETKIIHESMEESEMLAFFKECEYLYSEFGREKH